MDGNKLNRRLHSFRSLFSLRTYVVNMRMILNDPSVYPEMQRKTKRQRFKDNLIWLLKHHEVNRYYNTYGLDVVGFRNPDDFVPYRKFALVRDDMNLASIGGDRGYNRVCILRDKSVFAAFVSETVGKQYAVPVLASTDGRLANVYCGDRIKLEDYLNTRKEKDTILKKVNGECGDGVYLLTFENGWRVNHHTVKLSEFISEIEKSEYIIQDRVVQHKKLDRINPSCVNTIRFVTILDKKKKAQEFAHFLRIGVGDSVKDNRATGGYAVNILPDGVLAARAIGHHDSIVKHPDTGTVFEGFQLPFWPEVRELVKRVHEQLPDIKSIGWDVAITPDGPVLIEGNDNWEMGGPQDMEGGLKKRWKEMMLGQNGYDKGDRSCGS